MTLAARLREISTRTGISFATLMNRYHNLGLRGEALEAPVGALRRRRAASRPCVPDDLGERGYWPSHSKPEADRLINRALLMWRRIDPDDSVARGVFP